MVAQQGLANVFVTARRLVDLLEQDGFKLQTAVWALDEEGRGRLYLAPFDRSEGELAQTIRVAYTISEHREELPDRHDLLYSVVKPDNAVVQTVISSPQNNGRIRGVHRNGTYVDNPYILRPAA